MKSIECSSCKEQVLLTIYGVGWLESQLSVSRVKFGLTLTLVSRIFQKTESGS
jgi:hypothetical protein